MRAVHKGDIYGFLSAKIMNVSFARFAPTPLRASQAGDGRRNFGPGGLTQHKVLHHKGNAAEPTMRSFYRILRTALHALRRHGMRSMLTCLGIVIGIAAVIAMMEIGQGTAYVIRQKIATLGANLLQVEPGASSSSGVHSGAGTCLTLTPQDCEAILRECSAVRWAAPGVDCRMQVIYGNRNWAPWKILGTTPTFLVVRDWTDLQEGEAFTDSDVRSAAAVCLMGQTPAHELFGNESPVGKEVRVQSVTLKVVGVLSRKGANMTGLDQDDLVIAPWTTVKFRINGSKLSLSNLNAALNPASSLNQVNTLSKLYPNQQAQLYPLQSSMQAADTPQLLRFSDLDDIYVSANSPEDRPQAIDQITQLLRKRHRLRDGQPDDFGVRDWTEMSKTLASTSTLMTNLLLCVALIALVVGGVGIMNIMLVSVTERTGEIGLRMAVGARPRDILRQFLTEAVVLCLFGGIAGILVGRGISVAVTALLHWPTIPSMSAILTAVAVSATVGIVFGYYPAWKAARLDPIEALRYE
jgi:ABC-type antimicrobial peptide transport system permease subunit